MIVPSSTGKETTDAEEAAQAVLTDPRNFSPNAQRLFVPTEWCARRLKKHYSRTLAIKTTTGRSAVSQKDGWPVSSPP